MLSRRELLAASPLLLMPSGLLSAANNAPSKGKLKDRKLKEFTAASTDENEVIGFTAGNVSSPCNEVIGNGRNLAGVPRYQEEACAFRCVELQHLVTDRRACAVGHHA